MIDSVLHILAGLLLGIISGLTPGLHLNTIAAIASELAPKNQLDVILLIVAMNTMHIYTDFVPNILLGAPSETNYLSALPGHKLFLRGKGLLAIWHAVIGALLGTLLCIPMIPLFFLFAEQTKGFWWKTIPWVLGGTLLLLWIEHPTWKTKAWAIGVMSLSSALGQMALSNISNALFPLVTGFFGIPALLFSITQKQEPIPQEIPAKPLLLQRNLFPSFLGALAGSVVSFFPAIGPSQASVIVASLTRKLSATEYLTLLGSLSASATIFSFVALFAIQKARTGSAVAIQELATLDPQGFLLILTVILICSGISAMATIFLSIQTSRRISNVNPRTTSLCVLGFLAILITALNGATGLFLALCASAIGILCILAKVRRSSCMAFLIVPTIGYYISF